MAEQGKTWVLVRSVQGNLYVLRYSYWKELGRRHPAYDNAELILTSYDRNELVRFRDLTKEGV